MQNISIDFVSKDIETSPPQLGQIMTYTNQDILINFLPCDGRMLRRKKHPELFKVIGTKYGDADGSNTAFNLPVMTASEKGLNYAIYVNSER